MTPATALPASHAAPAPTPAQVAEAFLRPPRAPDAEASLDFLPGAQRFTFDGPLGPVRAARLGRGPAVLLVHGWGGLARDLAAFAPLLADAGFEIVALDLPAHGGSAGRRASIPDAAQALLALQAQQGGAWHGAIAHSVGTAALVHAMGRGLRVQRAALLAPPARYRDYAAGFARQAGLDADGTREMLRLLREDGLDVTTVDTPATARALTQPALLCHAEDDRVVPIADAEAIAAAWHGARLLRYPQLGHRRLLQSPDVLAAVLSFLQS